MPSQDSENQPFHPISSVPSLKKTLRQRIIEACAAQIDADPDATLKVDEALKKARLSRADFESEFPSEDALVNAILSFIDFSWGSEVFDGDGARGWPGLTNSEKFLSASLAKRGLARFHVRKMAEAVAADNPANDWLIYNQRIATELGNFTFTSGKSDGTVAEELDVDIAPIALNALVNGLRVYGLTTGREDLVVKAMRFVSEALEHQYRTGPDPA